jgi:uncharacterized protein (TIGR02996 family)
MTDGDALYRAILASPDDDAPRLVWADWLEENGDSDRAEFVRLQCELARLDPADLLGDELSEQLLRLTGNRETWTAGLGPYSRNCGFWRGLPDWFELTTDRLGAALADLRRHVAAQCLCLTIGRSGDSAFRDPGALEPVRCLDIAEPVPDPFYPQSSLRGWVWLFQSTRLRGLYALRADMDQTSVGFIDALGGTDWPNLRELSLRLRSYIRLEPPTDPWQQPPGPQWEDLADAPWFPGLRSLDLSHCFLDDGAMDRLLASDRPLALTRLNLAENSLGPTAIRRLTSTRALARVRRLVLGMNGIGATAADLLRSPALPELSSLDVSYCFGYGPPAGPEMLRQIAEAIHTGLRVLEANVCHCAAGSVARLVGSAGAAGLEVLSLNENELPDEAVVAIAESPHLGNLRRLSLQKNRITDSGLRALARSPRLSALRVLSLRGNDLTADVMRDPAVIDLAHRLSRLDTEFGMPSNEPRHVFV